MVKRNKKIYKERNDMRKLEKHELLTINGGGISFAVGAFIVAGVVFLIGVIDGYTRPYKCRT